MLVSLLTNIIAHSGKMLANNALHDAGYGLVVAAELSWLAGLGTK